MTAGLIIWAILISPVPLVASVYLLLCLAGGMHKRTKEVLVMISPEGRIRMAGEYHRIKYTERLFQPLFVVIHTHSGKKLQIWRDSCEEGDYRNLLVLLSGILK